MAEQPRIVVAAMAPSKLMRAEGSAAKHLHDDPHGGRPHGLPLQ